MDEQQETLEREESHDDDVSSMPEDAKHRINALLWELLPGAMTLAAADRIACEIHDMLERTWADRAHIQKHRCECAAPGKVAMATDNTGHGHVRARPDGVKARCGGPFICRECAQEAAKFSAYVPGKVAP